jgi:hypothetical protein
MLRRDRRTDEWSLRFVRTREPRTPLVPPAGDEEGEPH